MHDFSTFKRRKSKENFFSADVSFSRFFLSTAFYNLFAWLNQWTLVRWMAVVRSQFTSLLSQIFFFSLFDLVYCSSSAVLIESTNRKRMAGNQEEEKEIPISQRTYLFRKIFLKRIIQWMSWHERGLMIKEIFSNNDEWSYLAWSTAVS